MKLSIIKYNAGNIRSVLFALERIGVEAIVTDDKELIQTSDKVIFPGVGEASSAMQYLAERGLDKVILSLKQPVLGICLGMQLLCEHSEENDTKCLGIFNTKVKKFGDDSMKVPQIGWNQVYDLKGPLFQGVSGNSFFYFVHSYYAETCLDTVACTEYGARFSSALAKDNFYGVQFHAEKSSVQGEKILKNFLTI